MKILTYSDLHFELNKKQPFVLPEDIDGDIMILAGDILNFDDPRQLDNLVLFLKKWNKPVLYVAGNHEYYTDTKHDIAHLQGRLLKRLTERENIFFLDDKWVLYKNTMFYGGTMWTDLEDGTKAMHAAQTMNDYRYINHEGRKLNPKDTMNFHERFLNNLKAWLSYCTHIYPVRKRVVISHHCPIPENSKFAEQAAFVSTKTRAIIENPDNKIDLWVYGHTHSRQDYMVGNTRIISNPYGYEWHSDKDRFDPYGSVVEL